MTEGEEPPDDVQGAISNYRQQLEAIADSVCTDVDEQEMLRDLNADGAEIESQISFTARIFDYDDVEELFTAYLVEQRAAPYAVPNRAPTFFKLVQQYPGCAEGEYERGKFNRRHLFHRLSTPLIQHSRALDNAASDCERQPRRSAVTSCQQLRACGTERASHVQPVEFEPYPLLQGTGWNWLAHYLPSAAEWCH